MDKLSNLLLFNFWVRLGAELGGTAATVVVFIAALTFLPEAPSLLYFGLLYATVITVIDQLNGWLSFWVSRIKMEVYGVCLVSEELPRDNKPVLVDFGDGEWETAVYHDGKWKPTHGITLTGSGTRVVEAKGFWFDNAPIRWMPLSTVGAVIKAWNLDTNG